MGPFVFNLPIPLWWLREYMLCLIITIKSEVWTITHCLGLGHETMVSAVCLSFFFSGLHTYNNNMFQPTFPFFLNANNWISFSCFSRTYMFIDESTPHQPSPQPSPPQVYFGEIFNITIIPSVPFTPTTPCACLLSSKTYYHKVPESMMTSSNGNIFRVTGPLCGEFPGLRWSPRTKASDAELWFFLWSVPE